MGSQRHPRGIRAKYAFIKAHRNEFDTALMCRVLPLRKSSKSFPSKKTA